MVDEGGTHAQEVLQPDEMYVSGVQIPERLHMPPERLLRAGADTPTAVSPPPGCSRKYRGIVSQPDDSDTIDTMLATSSHNTTFWVSITSLKLRFSNAIRALDFFKERISVTKNFFSQMHSFPIESGNECEDGSHSVCLWERPR